MIIVLNNHWFGRKVWERRQWLKMSQKTLAEACGISVYSVRMIERGAIREVDAEVMQKMCAALESSMEEMTRT